MKGSLAIAAAASLAAGCALAGQNLTSRAPLDDEGEVYLELRPLAPAARRLSFEIVSVSALRADGSETILELALGGVAGAEAQRSRLLARGRLAPGSYSGFRLLAGKATVVTERGAADLLAPKEPVQIDAPFAIERRRVAVLALELHEASSIESGFAFKPSFTAGVPARTVPQLVGVCINTDDHQLTIFDKRAHEVTAVLATGHSPWGVALDPVVNRAYVALSGEDEIAVFDIAAQAEVGRIRLASGDGPRELALTPDRKLLVSVNAGSNTASFIDPISMIELARVQTGDEPTSLLIDRRGVRAYVFNRRSPGISVLDLAHRSLVTTVPTEEAPLRGQLDRAGTRLYVASTASAYLTAFSLPDLTIAARVYVGLGATAIKVDANTDLLYLARRDERQLAIFDPFSLIPIDTIELAEPVNYMVIDDAANALFMLMPGRPTIELFDLNTKKMLPAVDVGAGPHVIALMGERS